MLLLTFYITTTAYNLQNKLYFSFSFSWLERLKILLHYGNLGRCNPPNQNHRKTIAFAQIIALGYILKTINYCFRSRIGIKVRNYLKVLEMNRHGNNFIIFWFKKFNSKFQLLNLIAFWKKILTSNWQRQFEVWPWIAEGYIMVKILVYRWYVQTYLHLLQIRPSGNHEGIAI